MASHQGGPKPCRPSQPPCDRENLVAEGWRRAALAGVRAGDLQVDQSSCCTQRSLRKCTIMSNIPAFVSRINCFAIVERLMTSVQTSFCISFMPWRSIGTLPNMDCESVNAVPLSTPTSRPRILPACGTRNPT